jgi:ribosome-associated translation inhibitor RaiA
VASHLEMKISSFLDFKFVVPIVKAEIAFYRKRGEFTVTLNVPVVYKTTLRAEATSNDVLTSINLVTDKILDQLRRVKTVSEVRK